MPVSKLIAKKGCIPHQWTTGGVCTSSPLVWKLQWNMLPTRSRVKEIIREASTAECPLCNQEEETLIHLFIKCPIVRILWLQSQWPLKLELLPIQNIADWIEMIISPTKKLGLREEEAHHFQLLAVIILDFIWRQRNEIIHNHLSFSIEPAITQLQRIYQGYKEAWKEKKRSRTESWENPPVNFQSFSFDAAVRDSFSVASTVCRDHRGEILEIQTEKIFTSNPLIAEAKAALLATTMASQRQQERAILEGDSQLIIDAIIDKENAHWYVKPIIEDIKLLSAPHRLWNFAKIHRSANRCAHSVAQWAATNLVFGRIPTVFLSRCLLFIDSGKDPP